MIEILTRSVTIGSASQYHYSFPLDGLGME
jgi:hypothetical protein